MELNHSSLCYTSIYEAVNTQLAANPIIIKGVQVAIAQVWWPSRKRCWWQGTAVELHTTSQPSLLQLGPLHFSPLQEPWHTVWDEMRLSVQDVTKNLSDTLPVASPKDAARGVWGRSFLGSVSQDPKGAGEDFSPQGSSVTKRLEEMITEHFWKEEGRKWECNFLLRTVRLDPCSIFLWFKCYFLKQPSFQWLKNSNCWSTGDCWVMLYWRIYLSLENELVQVPVFGWAKQDCQG